MAAGLDRRLADLRRSEVEVGGRVLGSVTLTGGTPQGSPLSPALFTVYTLKKSVRQFTCSLVQIVKTGMKNDIQ